MYNNMVWQCHKMTNIRCFTFTLFLSFSLIISFSDAVYLRKIKNDVLVNITKVNNNTLLTHVPMIMSHDSGSGFLPNTKRFEAGTLLDWTKTQTHGLKDQADCGTRAFDARLYRSKDYTIWHHGPIPVPKKFSTSLHELKSWLSKNPNELLLILVSHCWNEDCHKLVEKDAKDAGVVAVNDCSILPALTYGKAKKLGALSDGGSLLIFTGVHGTSGTSCSLTLYNPVESCVVYNPSFTGCWTSDAGHKERMESLFEEVDKTLSYGLSDSHFIQTQALWQENPISIAAGMKRDSSLIIDTRKSNVNEELSKQVLNGRYPQLNFIEIDAVCTGGKELYDALQTTYFLDYDGLNKREDVDIL